MSESRAQSARLRMTDVNIIWQQIRTRDGNDCEGRKRLDNLIETATLERGGRNAENTDCTWLAATCVPNRCVNILCDGNGSLFKFVTFRQTESQLYRSRRLWRLLNMWMCAWNRKVLAFNHQIICYRNTCKS